MRPNPLFASDEPELVRALVREHPWATLVSATGAGLAASRYSVGQNKSEATCRRVIAALREKGPYRHPPLAEEMESELDENG